jgi:maltooligosyltrehalose trehalohydrolase
VKKRGWKLDLGAHWLSNKSLFFRVFAPIHSNLDLYLHNSLKWKKPVPMQKDGNGYFSVEIEGVEPNELYGYRLKNGTLLCDPVCQAVRMGSPLLSYAPSKKAFPWQDHFWKGIPLRDCIFYECHVGTFTKEGSFEGVRKRLKYLQDLGITCLELMPVSQFQGRWNWGYDVINHFAVEDLYGGPEELKKLINAAHLEGMGVCLDVVYNHFGPENNSAAQLGPYLTDRYQTQWGVAVNFDGPYSDEIRHFFIQNALYWISEYHIDVLRLDATHAIIDQRPDSFFKALSQAVHRRGKEMGKTVSIVAENDLNDSRHLRKNHSAFDGLWMEDFHHSLHVSLTDERERYYQDFEPISDLKKVLQDHAVYGNRYSSFRQRKHGNSFKNVSFSKEIAFLQNHDQIGNRPKGDRLASHLSFSAQKMAAVALLLSPFIPLLFMGEEYGETAPFPYFVDPEKKELLDQIIAGRKREMENEEGAFSVGEKAFQQAKLKGLSEASKSFLFALYRDCLRLRNKRKALWHAPKLKLLVEAERKSSFVFWRYPKASGLGALSVFCSFSDQPMTFPLPWKVSRLILHTEQKRYGGEESRLRLDKGRLFTEGKCALIWE